MGIPIRRKADGVSPLGNMRGGELVRIDRKDWAIGLKGRGRNPPHIP